MCCLIADAAALQELPKVAVATLATPAVEREIVACTALASMPGCG